jgi:hypothetical protein
MKLKIEINMDNDAMLNDPKGEVVRMIKLAVRQTELKKSCNLHDINGQIVGKMEVIPDILEREYNSDDFIKDQYVTIRCRDTCEKTVYNDVRVVTVMSNYIRVRVGVGQIEHVAYRDMEQVYYREN